MSDQTSANPIETLPGALAREISRITQLREQYREIQGLAGVNCAPAIAMMTAALKTAIRAAGSPDIEEQAWSLRDLRGFTS